MCAILRPDPQPSLFCSTDTDECTALLHLPALAVRYCFPTLAPPEVKTAASLGLYSGLMFRMCTLGMAVPVRS